MSNLKYALVLAMAGLNKVPQAVTPPPVQDPDNPPLSIGQLDVGAYEAQGNVLQAYSLLCARSDSDVLRVKFLTKYPDLTEEQAWHLATIAVKHFLTGE